MDLSSGNGVSSRIGTKTFEKHEDPGRPKLHIQSKMLEELTGIRFPWIKVGDMFGVSRWTISRRVREYGLRDIQGFSDLSDTDLDSLVSDFLERHGHSAGQVYVSGYLKSIGLRIQRQRVRESLVTVDSDNRILRWGIVISRRVYYVPWPNSIWHLDGHHSLICWRMVVHVQTAFQGK